MICDLPSTTRDSRQAIWPAMATLTSGLSHGLRNPLCAVELRLSALPARRDAPMSGDSQEAVREILATIQRLGHAAERLCSFSPVACTGDPLDPLPLIREEVRRAAREREAIRCHMESTETGRAGTAVSLTLPASRAEGDR